MVYANNAPPPNPDQLVVVEGQYLDKKDNPITDAFVEYRRDGVQIASDITDATGYFHMDVLLVGVDQIKPEQNEFLLQNYPNPFVGQTTIETSIKESGNLKIFDVTGKLVNSIELQRPGKYKLQWNGNAPVGVYVCALTSGNNAVSKKMINQGSGFGAGLSIIGYEQLTNDSPSLKNTTIVEDTLSFQKNNTTLIEYQFELLGDTTFIQEGNPGPNEYNPIPNSTGLEGDTLSWYMFDHVYNDETTNQYSTVTPGTWVSSDTLFHIVQAGTTQVNLDVIDLTDPTLQALVSFNVTSSGSGNQPPVAVDDTGNADEDNAVTIDVVANDYDPDGNIDPTSVSTTGVLQPSNGSTSINSTTGEITYTPDANWFGTDTFEYVVWDDGTPPLSDTALVTVNVASVNDPPTANDDNASTPYQTAVAIDVVVNDVDIDGSIDPTTVSNNGLLQPSNGSISINPTSGVITYTPNNNWSGDDTFEYEVADDGSPVLWDTAMVYVTVAPPGNSPPVAVDDVGNADEDNAVTIDVVANDYDPDNNLDPTSVTNSGLLQPSNGSISINSTTGAITYTPNNNWFGTDNFEYRIYDTGSPPLSDVALVTVNIASVNDAPVAVNDAANTNEDYSVIVPVLSNDYDIDGNLVPSSVSVTTQPAHGSVAVNTTNGNITYTPAANWFGVDTFIYQVGDDGTPQLFDNATVTVTVASVNDAPVAVDDNANVDEDNAVTIDVLVNDYDIDGNLVPSSVSVVTQPSNGNVSVNTSNGNITYTPAANWFGVDTFVYQVGDDGTPQLFDDATVTVTVASVNDPPVAVDDSGVTNENTPVTIDVLANDSDPLDPGGALIPSSTSVTTQPLHGSTSVNTSTGAITYTPANGWSGNDSFVYEVGDNGTPQLFDDATVSVTVNAVGQTYIKVMDIMQDSLLTGCTLHIGSNSYVLSAGDTTMTITPGTYEVNATHPNTIDWTSIWEEYTAIQRPGQDANVQQRARNDYSSLVTFTSSDDTLYIYKVMDDFNMYDVRLIIGSGPQGQTGRFSYNDLNAPAWFDLNYTPPTTTTRDRVQYWVLQQLPPATKGKLNMVYEEDNSAPTVPYLQMAIDPSFNASNNTFMNGNIIDWCYARWPNNSQSYYTLGIEILQAVGDLNDIGSNDPPILSYEGGSWVINHTGQECFHLLYNFDPGTRF